MYSDYYDSIGKVAETDKEVADAMALELKRQRDNIELIASENLVSPQVMVAMGSVLTNKYAEGLPGKRYYGGCQYVDIVENIAIKELVNFSNAILLMFSLIRALRLILQFISLFLSRVIPLWV